MKTWIKKIGLLLSLITFSGCNGLVQNSNSNDEDFYSNDFIGGLNFKAIAPVLVLKCAGCHQEYAGYSELEYEAAGLVVQSNPGASQLYYRLSNSPVVGPQPRNMPQGGGAAFTDGEIQKLADWINGFGL
jgi:uncharacterized membrane protein